MEAAAARAAAEKASQDGDERVKELQVGGVGRRRAACGWEDALAGNRFDRRMGGWPAR